MRVLMSLLLILLINGGKTGTGNGSGDGGGGDDKPGANGKQIPPIIINDDFNSWLDSTGNDRIDKYVDMGVILSILSIISIISIASCCIVGKAKRKRKGYTKQKVLVDDECKDKEVDDFDVEKIPFNDK